MEDVITIGYNKDDRDDERHDITVMMVCRTHKTQIHIIKQFVGDEAERMYEILTTDKRLPQEVDKRIEKLKEENQHLNRILSAVSSVMESW